jgi:hypothetical protein
MDAHPTTEESLTRLRAAGWSPVEESWTFPRGRWVYGVVVAKGGRELAGEGRGEGGLAPGRGAGPRRAPARGLSEGQGSAWEKGGGRAGLPSPRRPPPQEPRNPSSRSAAEQVAGEEKPRTGGRVIP